MSCGLVAGSRASSRVRHRAFRAGEMRADLPLLNNSFNPLCLKLKCLKSGKYQNRKNNWNGFPIASDYNNNCEPASPAVRRSLLNP